MTKEQLDTASETAARIIVGNVDPNYKEWISSIIFQQFFEYVENRYEPSGVPDVEEFYRSQE